MANLDLQTANFPTTIKLDLLIKNSIPYIATKSARDQKYSCYKGININGSNVLLDSTLLIHSRNETNLHHAF